MEEKKDIIENLDEKKPDKAIKIEGYYIFIR